MKTNLILVGIIILMLIITMISDTKAIEKCKTTGRTEFECVYELNR